MAPSPPVCPSDERRRSLIAAPPRPGRRGRRRSGGRWPGRSPPPSPRPPAAQRAGALHLGPQQLVLHAELADAPHGGGELAVGLVRLALLQRSLERGLGLLAPLLEPEHRQAELPGEQLG